jgi:K+-transporting ATPase ATPase C chain
MRVLREAFTLLVVLTVLTGLVYPLVVTWIAQVVFPERADGSLIRGPGGITGSALIGQPFQNPGYFWSRPSATSVHPYNAGISSGSNLGSLHTGVTDTARDRIAALRSAGGVDPAEPVPVDLVTTSGSGLDPHISPAAALYQVGRVTAARGVPLEEIRALVERRVEPRRLGILGEPRVNVLLLNQELDKRYGPPADDGADEEGKGAISQ